MKQVVSDDSETEKIYPYANLLSCYRGDSQLLNVSRNGQYCVINEGFANDEERVSNYLKMLGTQNNVSWAPFVSPAPTDLVVNIVWLNPMGNGVIMRT